MTRLPSLFISVQPVGSGFAKALQLALRAQTLNKIYRVDHEKAHRKILSTGGTVNVFSVTYLPANKVQQFKAFKENNISSPAFTTNVNNLDELGSKTVFARTLINSTGGKGIVEFNLGEGQVPQAPLYTAYIPKKAEYRVHIFGGEVIDVQQKKKKRGVDERNTRIRNLENGYVYTREALVPPNGMGQLAIDAVAAVGYSYGAVDIIYNEKLDKCFVLEVNSRPGLMGTTLQKYTDALIKKFTLVRKV